MKTKHTQTNARSLARWLRRKHDFDRDDAEALRDALARNDDLYFFLRHCVGMEVARRAQQYQEKGGPLVRIVDKPKAAPQS